MQKFVLITHNIQSFQELFFIQVYQDRFEWFVKEKTRINLIQLCIS